MDINTTHFTLLTPESRAIGSVLRCYRPDLVNDLHEYRAAGGRLVMVRNVSAYGKDIEPAVKAFGIHFSRRYQEPAIQAGGVQPAHRERPDRLQCPDARLASLENSLGSSPAMAFSVARPSRIVRLS